MRHIQQITTLISTYCSCYCTACSPWWTNFSKTHDGSIMPALWLNEVHGCIGVVFNGTLLSFRAWENSTVVLEYLYSNLLGEREYYSTSNTVLLSTPVLWSTRNLTPTHDVYRKSRFSDLRRGMSCTRYLNGHVYRFRTSMLNREPGPCSSATCQMWTHTYHPYKTQNVQEPSEIFTGIKTLSEHVKLLS